MPMCDWSSDVCSSDLTLCNPMDYTVHGILQAIMLEWAAVPFFRGSSQPRDQTRSEERRVGNEGIGVQCRRARFDSWVRKIPWRRESLPTPVSWPGEVHGLYSPWGHKESDRTERLSLSLLSTILSRSIHAAANGIISFFFMRREGREHLPHKVGESILLSRSGGEMGLR